MKPTSLLVPLLAAAALAASAGVPSSPAPRSSAQPTRAPLEEDLHAAHAHVHGAETDDPHEGLYAATDPHAALHGSHDPHAALHGSDGPHSAADPHAPRAPDAARSVTAVERSRAPNGRTVAEVFAQRAALAGQRVALRASVVKATDGVLGKTYLHLQDGSGSAELATHDLTATTTEAFELGETVEVEGVLAIDQDVGLDYRYPALLGDVRRLR